MTPDEIRQGHRRHRDVVRQDVAPPDPYSVRPTAQDGDRHQVVTEQVDPWVTWVGPGEVE